MLVAKMYKKEPSLCLIFPQGPYHAAVCLSSSGLNTSFSKSLTQIAACRSVYLET